MENETEINFHKFHDLIEGYETLIKDLTEEVDFYKSESSSNKAKITLLISENNELSTKLKDAQKLFENGEINRKYSENDLVENLKTQLSVLSKEKQSVVQLWQSSLQTVDYLEEELKVYQGRTHGYILKTEVEKVYNKYEAQIKALEAKIAELQTELNETIKVGTKKLEIKNEELDKALKNERESLEFVKDLEQEIKILQDKLNAVEEMRKDTQKLVDEKNIEIHLLRCSVEQSKLKVEEAVQIAEYALMERDAACLSEAQAKEELIKASETLSKTKTEFEDTIAKKVNTLTKEYSDELKKAELQNNKVQEDLKNSKFELEKCSLKCEALEREISILKTGDSQTVESSMSKLLVLDKNLESTFQKLLISERKCLQLTSERDNIKSDLEQMAGYFERDIKAREVEKKSLEHQIKTLQKELDVSNSNLLEITSKMNQLHSTIRLTANEVKKQYHIKQIIFKNALEEKVKNTEAENYKIYNELRKQLKLQMLLNKKWKSESKTIHEKLSKRIQQIKEELVSAESANGELRQKLKDAENKIEKYRKSLQTICQDVNSLCK